MSYSIIANDRVTYQPPALQQNTHLALLEDACAPYLRAGYKITGSGQDSFVLTRERAPVSVLAVIVLLPIPLLALLYIIIARNNRDSVACVRVNSRGQIEESGDTLTLAAAQRAARRTGIAVLVVVIIVAVFVVGGAFYYRSVGNNAGVSRPGSSRALPASADNSNLNLPPSGTTTKRSQGKSKDSSKAANTDNPYAANPYSADMPDLTFPAMPATADSIEPTAPKTLARKEPKPDELRMMNEGGVMFPAKANGTVYRHSEVDTPAEIISHTEPIYNRADVKTPGMVQVEAVLRPDGTITDVRVLKALSPVLTSAAIKAARAITFTPAIKDGLPVPMLIRLNYNFNPK
ncbi:MAG: energy transducer TonB [Pyrinomonadaceae bacterium MAG19_C2-C3]|nr:energy transducer TonB [Pyrinomonadaceae bacterium MAG19_C2-C3]